MAVTLEATDPRPPILTTAEHAAPPDAPGRRLTMALLGAILVVALGLRLWGLDWGLPWAFHPDEIFYVDQAQDILKFGDPNPKYFKNPSLLTYLIVGELLVAQALGALAGPFGPDAAGSSYLLARLIGAVAGTASAALVFATGTTLFNRRVGLLGAMLLAISFLHVRDSHYGVNDVPATALLLLSLYGSARLLRDGGLRWYLLAGLAGGLATSTKYNMGFFFLPILVAHCARARQPSATPTRPLPLASSLARAFQGAPLLHLSAAAVASLGGYLLGTPYTLLDFRRFSGDFMTQYRFGDQRWLGQPLEPVPLLYLTSLLQGFGALALLLALVGLLLAWRKRRPAAALLIAFPAIYLAFLMPKELFFPRLAIPLLPALCLLAAYAASELSHRLPGAWRGVSLAVLMAAVLAQPLTNDLLHSRLLREADTRIVANEWVQANLPAESRLRIEDYSLRDLSTQSRTYTPNSADLKIERFAGSPEAESAQAFADKNVQYVVTSSFAFDRYLLDPPLPAQQKSGERYQRLHRSLERRAELVARFSPGRDNAELPYRLDDLMTPFWSLEHYERPGPTIRIYSVEHLAGDS